MIVFIITEEHNKPSYGFVMSINLNTQIDCNNYKNGQLSFLLYFASQKLSNLFVVNLSTKGWDYSNHKEQPQPYFVS